MIRTKKIILLISMFVLPFLFSAIFVSYNTYAEVSKDDIVKKWVITQFRFCATNGRVNNVKKAEGGSNNEKVALKIMNNVISDIYLPSYSYGDSFNTKNGGDHVLGNTAYLNCDELFRGANNFSNSALSYTSFSPSVTWNSGAKDLLDAMKYTGGSSERVAVKARVTRTGSAQTYFPLSGQVTIASLVKNNGLYSAQKPAGGGFNWDYVSELVDYFNTRDKMGFSPKSSISITDYDNPVVSGGSVSYPTLIYNFNSGDIKNYKWSMSNKVQGTSLDDIVNKVKSDLGNKSWSWGNSTGGIGLDGFTAEKAIDTGSFVYHGNDNNTNRLSMMQNLFGKKYYTSYNDIVLTKAEKLTLYQYYVGSAVKKISGSQINCESENSPGDFWYEVKMKQGTDVKKCYVQFGNLENPSNIEVYAQFGSGGDIPEIKKTTLEFVIRMLNEASDEDFADASSYDAVMSSGNSGNVDGVEPTCENSGAAESLGWIVCPILSFMSNASQTLYDEFVEPALQVNPKLFVNGPTDGTRDGWEIFRNIANTFFIILLLIVIFSQLTGVGIDNYGIKKILPKLILAALLINVSYLICVIFVDLSNIVGNGLQQLFNSMGEGLTISEGDYPIDIASRIGSTAITGVAILGVAVVGIWSVASSEGLVGLLMVLLIAAISVIVALFFLFLLLAAREAAIVVLTVISPLAFACLMLPNTKSFFDKWLKFGWALLLVYPIAGLLVGGGNFVSKLLLVAGAGAGGFFSAFMAMIISVVPIFFIPTVLKNSFQALGNLGAKISGMGKTVGSKLTGATDKTVKGSERWKNYQADRSRQRKINAARRTAGRYLDKDGKVRAGLSNRQQRSLAQAMSIQLGEESETRKRENLLHGGYEAAMAGIESSADAEVVKNTEAMLENGKVKLGGRVVNTNDAKAMGAYYANALRAYSDAADAESKKTALAQIKAAQNILSKTDKGRAEVQNELANATRNATTDNGAEAVQMAASHLMSGYGDTYKSKNRGANEMITDLATSSPGLAGISGAQSKLGPGSPNDLSDVGSYAASGARKYTAESLSGADDQALDNIIKSINNGALNNADAATVNGVAMPGSYDAVRNSAYEALHNENIHLKPEVEDKLKQIVGNYVPPNVAQANAPRVLSHGAYEDSAGNVYHLHEMDDGKYLDDNGFEVDITHFKKR